MYLRGLGYSEASIRRAVIELSDHGYKDLSAKLKISRSHLSNIVSGVRKSLLYRKEISKMIGVPVDIFFCDTKKGGSI